MMFQDRHTGSQDHSQNHSPRSDHSRERTCWESYCSGRRITLCTAIPENSDSRKVVILESDPESDPDIVIRGVGDLRVSTPLSTGECTR